jgi:membrane-bound lytic murein transglycosylase MltF
VTKAGFRYGPGNLKRFRDYATKHGLDPNRWFGNVENGAAAIIGQGTVGCIGNIHKCYIVYSARQKAVQQETKNSDATPGGRQS